MKEEDENRKKAIGQSKKGRVSPRNNIIKRIVVLAIILSVTLTASTFILNSKLPRQELMYIQAAEVAIIGYFVLETISAISYKLALPDSSLETAKAIRSFVRITGTIIIVATIISYLAQNPIVAASISTISALVIGFASQNILANMISGLYLSLVRPFKIGDKITISSNSGIIYDIELVYVRLMTENGDIVLVPSSSMVSGTVIVNKS
ncbi:MAG TPA: mechanosensitive ion channel domain-containing protein [Nitrososphaeraceae archaeon]|nr:mechanosensitive ion channel domain-containing protein [Nitrososphaeraceae archaeon]